MPVRIRPATPEDAPALLRVIDLASEGLLPTLWAGMAPKGVTADEVGLGLVTAEAGDFSYTSGWLAERHGTVGAGMICYRLPDPPGPADPDTPPAFAGVEALAAQVPGWWYINFFATLPEYRHQGLGKALLEKAEDLARAVGCDGIALIVAASNGAAIKLYQRAGYVERAREPFDLAEYGHAPTEAILMVRALG